MPRELLNKETEHGGLKLPLPSHIDTALRIAWINKADNTDHPWKEFVKELQDPVVLAAMSTPITNREIEKMDLLPYNKAILKAIRTAQISTNVRKTWTTSALFNNPHILDKKAKKLKWVSIR